MQGPTLHPRLSALFSNFEKIRKVASFNFKFGNFLYLALTSSKLNSKQTFS